MARVTVEDCLNKVKNRFELVLLAAKRARQLLISGTEPLVPWENDKVTVVALREIAEGKVNMDLLNDAKAQAAARLAEEIRQEEIQEEIKEEIKQEIQQEKEAAAEVNAKSETTAVIMPVVENLNEEGNKN